MISCARSVDAPAVPSLAVLVIVTSRQHLIRTQTMKMFGSLGFQNVPTVVLAFPAYPLKLATFEGATDARIDIPLRAESWKKLRRG